MISLENFSFHYPNMRIGRFTLKAGERIPLHMHTNQFAMAYLLSGRCQLMTYAIETTEAELVQLVLEKKEEVTAHSYSVLTPKINAHKIYAIEDCVFLDIFAPGKDEGALSEYLEVVGSGNSDALLTAKKIPTEKAGLPDSLVNNLCHYTEIS